jgi:hypothetical protein
VGGGGVGVGGVVVVVVGHRLRCDLRG